ncbi:MAG: hypothetical protein P8188_01290 [Gemmatimonadota bacterium]
MFRRSNVCAAAIVLLALALPPDEAAAQDSHYWSEQYGTRSALLGGALIGSVRDLSSTFYNPGAAALNLESRFLLSARAYRRSETTLEDGGGEGVDLTTSNQRPLPTILATPIEFDWLGKHRIIYSVLTRQQYDADLSTYDIGDRDVLPAPGDEVAASAYTGTAELRETWTGITWAYPLTERVGIGVTPYLAVRSQTIKSQTLLQAASSEGDVAIATRLRNRDFRHYRGLAKIGLAGEFGRWSVGVTATTPSFSISGSGRAAFNGSSAGVEGEDDVLVADVQSDLSSTYESGWAVGAGFGLQFGGTRLHGSAEWFQAIDPFTVLDAEDFVPQTGGDVLVNDMTAELESVLNWGLGLEQSLGRTMLFAGVALDRSAANPDAPAQTTTTLTNYDLWRYSAGASFRLGRSEFMLGLAYAQGSQPFPQVLQDRIETGLGPLEEDIQLRFTQWTVVLGYEFATGGGGDDEEAESRER